MTLARARSLERTRAAELPGLTRRYSVRQADYFRGMFERIEAPCTAVVERRVRLAKADDALENAINLELGRVDWDAENRILSRQVTPITLAIGDAATSAVGRELRLDDSFDLPQPVPSLSTIGTRVRQVSATSRRQLAGLIADGLQKGLSVEQIVRGVPPGTTNIRGPVPAFRGIAGLVDSWSSTGQPGFAGAVGTVPLRSSRAYLIALTETGNAFNQSAIASYRASGFVDFVEVFDGPDCGWSTHDDPELAHGSIRSLDSAKAHPLSHPRCQRSFGAAIQASAPAPSPFQGRPATNVPGATPGLRPDDPLPFRGELIPRAPAAIRPGAPPPVTALSREAALEEAANRIRFTTTHETAVVVDDAGNVLIDKADPTKPRSVDFTPEELLRMRGATLTHNHPLAYQHDLPHATAFSPDDALLALSHGLREIRAVGKGADHVLRIDSSWVTPMQLRQMIDRTGNEVRSDFIRRIAAGEIDITYAETNHFHELWTRIASLAGGKLVYQRTLRPEVP